MKTWEANAGRIKVLNFACLVFFVLNIVLKLEKRKAGIYFGRKFCSRSLFSISIKSEVFHVLFDNNECRDL